jgi:FlaA1/EpsC-like NDP-sugar epimerase
MIFDINRFINEKVTGREKSFFEKDLENNKQELEREITNKKVLVIGGAGTIGGSFIKALLHYNPATLVVVDINENGLTELTRDLRSSDDFKVPSTYLTYPVNFKSNVFRKLLRAHGPFDIVANFAAHKHVRSEKDIFSIEAMLENNTLNAKYLLDLLNEQKPKHFFCVSTDKAANPVNIMGASKKLMEDVIMAYSTEMKITTARFANVAFSNGSLPAGFIERLFKRQPLSAPSDVKRYFVSPKESGQICLLACILGKSGEVFFPKLDESNMTTFSQIATDLLHWLGFEPELCSSEDEAREKAAAMKDNTKSYPVIYFASDTSGEKSFEEFYTEHEQVDFNRLESLGIITNMERKRPELIGRLFADLQRTLDNDANDKATLVAVLKDYLPNFQHIETGKSLDQKM